MHSFLISEINQHKIKGRILVTLIIFMWAGLFWSRAILSISTALFLFYALYISGKKGVQEFQRSIWLRGMFLIFLIPFISGLWSADKKTWLEMVVDKLPLLFFPFIVPAFTILIEKSKTLLMILISFILISILYSIGMYWSAPNMNDLYLKAKVLKVLMSGDHVRYSLLLLIALIWIIHQYFMVAADRWKGILFVSIIGVFLHVLAAKTGLVGFYLLIFLLILYKAKGVNRIGGLIGLSSFPLVAWFLFPSFQNRLKFVLWDFQHYSRGGYVEGLSDTPRIFSFRGGYDIAKENLFTGVGAGDVKSNMVQWYTSHASFIKGYEQLLPSNELLFYTCIAGIISGMVMLFVLIIPFFVKRNHSFLWVAFHLIFFMISMYEISLETQYGVFLYAFFGILFFMISSPDHRLSRSSTTR